MAYCEERADRIRRAIKDIEGITERKMFGGLTFMLKGNMCCGIAKSDLVVPVGPDGYEDALEQPHARVMDFTGRPLRGMVYVAPAGYKTSEASGLDEARGEVCPLAASQVRNRARAKAGAFTLAWVTPRGVT